MAFLGKGYYRNMRRGWIVPKFADGFGYIAGVAIHIGEDEHGAFVRGGLGQLSDVRHRQHAITEVLQPVDQQAAGHQLFIQDKCQWFLHEPTLKHDRSNSKFFGLPRDVFTEKCPDEIPNRVMGLI